VTATDTTTVRVRTAAAQDPGDLLARLPEGVVFAWVRHGDGLVGWGEAHRVPVGTGAGRFPAAVAALEGWFAAADVDREIDGAGTGPVAFASMTFDPRTQGSQLVIPRVVVGRSGGRCWITTVGGAAATLPDPTPLPEPTRIRYAGASAPEVRWLEAVDAVAGEIRTEGPLQKVVLARDLQVWSAEPLDVRPILRRLSARFSGCWTFAAGGLVGATPELLVRRRGTAVESLVLAGSAPRGRDRAQDDEAAAALARSHKDRVEHDLAVGSVVEVLTGLCSAVEAEDEPHLLRLANVQHLATRVTGTLLQPLSALAVAGALHPTAAVCGTPVEDAMGRIRELERMDRGRYSGPVGWVDAAGDGEFGIALRCAEISGTRGRLFAGAGIVGESLPELELEETRLKLRAMQSALEATPAAPYSSGGRKPPSSV